jgi:hypothetical protein
MVSMCCVLSFVEYSIPVTMFEGGSRLGYLELLDIELLKSLAEHLQDRETERGLAYWGFLEF